MNSCEQTFQLFSAQERQEIKDLLARWSITVIGGVIVRNIHPLERFLPKEELYPILEALHRNRGLDVVKLGDVYQQNCWDHVMKGGKVTLDPKPTPIGRAVAKKVLVNTVRNSKLFQKHVGSATDFVNKLISGHPPSGSERQVLMSPHAAWVTWDDQRPGGNPFLFAAGKGADYLRACLGLDPRTRRAELLLLTYDLQPGSELLRPTVADADIFPFFEPPHDGFDAHGLTKPWLPGLLPRSAPELQRRPEAIHGPQPFARLLGIVRAGS
jgi:hypothetical protein